MKAFKYLLLLMSILLALFTCGCAGFSSWAHSDSSWPKPISASDLQQFEGIYPNDSLVAKRHQDDEPWGLFDFLTGEIHSYTNTEMLVEISPAPDGSSLSVRLFDKENHQIASANLQRGVAFKLSDGSLALYGPLRGRHGRAGDFGPYTQYERAKLRVTSTGGLRGHESQNEEGLLFDIIPEAGRVEWSMFWPKVAK